MKMVIRFLKTSMMGGLLFALPAGLTALALHWLVMKLIGLMRPLVSKLSSVNQEVNIVTYYGISLVAILALFFLIGVLIQTSFGKFLSNTFHNLMSKLPFYKPIKTIVNQLTSDDSPFKNGKAGLVKLYGANVDTELWCIRMSEDKELGVCTVFCMSAPTPMSGYVYNVNSSQFREVDGVGVEDVMRLTLSCGVGSKDYYKAAYPDLRKQIKI